MNARRTAAAGGLAARLLAACLLAAGAAHADPVGDRLRLEVRCASDDGSVAIVPDGWLSHRIAVEGSTSSVGAENGTVVVVAGCHDGTLTIRVPPDFPVAIDAGGQGALRLGDLRGPVTATLRDGVTLTGGHLSGRLSLTIGNDGDVEIGALDGPARLESDGSGDLSIARIMAPSVQATQSGSGDMRFGAGRIGTLDATVTGSGDLSIAGTVLGGQVTSTGSGDVSIARVSGDLTQVQTGSGDITVRARGDTAPPSRPVISIKSGRGSPGLPVVLLVLLALACVLVGRRRWRRRPERALPVDPRVSVAADRLDAVGRRIGRLEALVTSGEFELNRRFREMGD